MTRTRESAETEPARGDLPRGALAVGLGAVVLLLVAVWGTQRTVGRDLVWVESVGRIEADAAIAHLWVEELVAGDPIDAAEIDRRLEHATRLADALAARERQESPIEPASAETPTSRRPESPPDPLLDPLPLPEPLPDGAARDDAHALATSLDAFRALCDERRLAYRRGLPVAAGSRFDQEFDAAFRILLDRIDALKMRLEQDRVDGDRERMLRFALVALTWICALIAAGGALRRFDRGRLRAERALASSHEHLERSQRLESVGRLARGLAHDLNNYLAAVRSQCELVATRALRAESADGTGEPEATALVARDVADRMRAVLDTVDKASTLLADLLTFGRSHASRTALLVPGERIAAMQPMLRASAGGAVRLEIDVDGASWPIRIDPARFDQAILNLVVNARDAMPSGGVLRLVVRDRSSVRGGRLQRGARGRRAGGARTGDQVELRVVDTGVGIPASDLEEIFEPFVSRKGGEHSGLGLAMVYALVRQSGGSVAVDSTVDEGTTFRLSFPRAEPDGSTPVAEATTSNVAAFDPRGEESLLFVDDNEEYREATAALLETLGYRVATAASGEQAEQLFELADSPDNPVDLLVADIVMAGVDGRTLAHRLRTLRPDLPVVLLSGDPRLLEPPTPALDEGFEWVRKESSTAALTHAMRRALDRTAAEARARRGRPSSSRHLPPDTMGSSEK